MNLLLINKIIIYDLNLNTKNIIIIKIKDPVELIDQSLFVDILALCALDLTFRDPEPTDFEKVISRGVTN